MTIRVREFLAATATVGLLATGACHQPLFEDSGGPETPYVEAPQVEQPPYQPYAQPAPPPPPPQAYSPQGPQGQPYPPPPPGRGLAGGPPPPPREPEVTILMAPIPNPEDLSPQDRARVYGPGERAQAELAGGPAAPGASNQGRVYARPPGATGVEQGPAATRKGGAARLAQDQSASQNNSAMKPATAASRPATRAARPAPAASRPAAPKPAAPKTALTNAEQLGAALAGDVANGAVIEIPAAIANGSDGIVTLTLPPSLYTRMRSEADKVGLGLQARSADVSAALSGEGYEITPNQSQSTALRENESAALSWQVSPQEGASGKLAFKIGADLKGASRPEHVEIADIERDVSAEPAAGDAQSAKLPRGWVYGGLLGLLALVIGGVFLNRQNRNREAERRRKAREAASAGEYGQGMPEADEKPAAAPKPKDKPK